MKSYNEFLEVGPGLGALTKFLAKYNLASLSVVEIDKDLVEKLVTWIPSWVKIYSEDIRKFDLTNLSSSNIRIIGNLPYNISTPILIYCLDNLDYIKDMNFMLQREVVERICAQPGSSNYGRLSVRMQVDCEVNQWLDVPNTAFNPQPKVESAMIGLRPKDIRPYVDKQKLDLILRTAFSARRKVLSNSLRSLFSNRDIIKVGVDPGLRPDAVTVDQYIELTTHLSVA